MPITGPTTDPQLVVTMARMWNRGCDTLKIASAIERDEAWVANRIDLIKLWARRLRSEGEVATR